MESKNKILYISSIIVFSLYFIYDIPAAMNKFIDFNSEGSTEYKLSLLYSAYAFPNIIIPIIFGFSPKIDCTVLSNILCIVFCIGHLIFTLGIYTKNFAIMIIGRLVLGIGGESFSVIQNKIISVEFKDSEITFSLSIFSSIGKLGTIANYLITPVLAKYYGPTIPCLLGGLLSLKAILLCFYLNEKYIRNKKLLMLPDYTNIIKTDDLDEEETNEVSLDKTSEHKVDFDLHFRNNNIRSSKEQNSYYEDFQKQNSDYFFSKNLLQESPFKPWSEISENNDTTKNGLEVPKQKESDITDRKGKIESLLDKHSLGNNESPVFPKRAFVYFALILFCFSLINSGFNSVAPLIIHRRFNLPLVKSTQMLSIIEIISLVLSLCLAKFVDRVGYKTYFILLGFFFLILSHFSITAPVINNPFVPIVLLGTTSPFLSILWSCIPSIINENHLTRAFSLLYCFLNFGYLISPLIIRRFTKNYSTYYFLEFFFILLSLVGLGFMLLLSFENRMKVLNKRKTS